MATKYYDVVFLSGDESDEAFDILKNARNAEYEVVEYLKQWDNGEYGSYRRKPPWGDSDSYFYAGDYALSYNWHLGYIGLTYIETDETPERDENDVDGLY